MVCVATADITVSRTVSSVKSGFDGARSSELRESAVPQIYKIMY